MELTATLRRTDEMKLEQRHIDALTRLLFALKIGPDLVTLKAGPGKLDDIGALSEIKEFLCRGKVGEQF